MSELSKIIDSVEGGSTTTTPQIVSALIVAAAEEVQAWYQYTVPILFLQGPERSEVAESFSKLGEDELDDHFNSILKRLRDVGADVQPLMDFRKLSSVARCEYATPESPYEVKKLVEDNIRAEECAIATYENLCDMSKYEDVATFNLAKRILKDERSHLQTLKDFAADFEAIQSFE